MNLVNFICGELAIDKCEITSPRRDRLLVEKRKIAVYVLRLMGWSFSKIGRELKRDHTTVSYLYKSAGEKEREAAEIIVMLWGKHGE